MLGINKGHLKALNNGDLANYVCLGRNM